MIMITKTMANKYLKCATCLGLLITNDFMHACAGYPFDGDFTIDIERGGSYRLLVQNDTWLHSAPTFFRFDNDTFSTSNGTLQLRSLNLRNGKDAIGRYTQTTMSYVAKRLLVEFEVSITAYQDVPLILFTQFFSGGANWTQADNIDGVCSGFPGFQINSSETELGYLSYGGVKLGIRHRFVGIFDDTSTINDGIAGGPLVLFNREGQTIIISPFNNFMAASFWQDSISGGHLYAGIMGGVRHVPLLYKQTFMIVFGSSINKAFASWGSILRSHYAKDTKLKENDVTLNYLGYWTDIGMYYYFHTDKNKTYEQTLIDVKAEADLMHIPIRYMQYGPWWYYRGDNHGVKTWNARPEIFPDGFSDTFHQLGWPSVASTTFWSNATSYAKQNGGHYSFIIQGDVALPLDQSSLADQTISINQILEEIYFGGNWLKQMDDSARKYNMSIQYGMAYPRHALQTLDIQTVTQAIYRQLTEEILVNLEFLRPQDMSLTENSSQVFLPAVVVADIISNTTQEIGLASLLAGALGVAPSTGPFLTHAEGTSYYGHPELNSAIATLSTGPVGVEDRVGDINKTTLMRCCNGDGLILNPEFPARAIDKQILKMVFPETDGPSGEAWISYSDISGLRFANLLVFGIENGTQFSVNQKDTGLFDHAGDDDLYYAPYNNPLGWGILTTFGELTFTSECSWDNFCLNHLATAIPDWFMTVIFGEMDKWVPVSPKRVLDIVWTNDTVTAPLHGAANETFDFWYMLGSKIEMVTCTLNSTGSATFKMDNILGIATCGSVEE